MTSIHDLPEEILYMIFGHSTSKIDLKQFQRVSRAWYHPAHLILLKYISLNSSLAISNFVHSIDYNPNPTYLKAVKYIYICLDPEDDLSPLDEDHIQKMFLRFPNLKDVKIEPSTLLGNFNDEICKRISLMCPKLEYFGMLANGEVVPQYNDLIRKVRLLITYVELEQFNYLEGNHDVTQILDDFPRLRHVAGYASGLLVNFKQLLQIMENSPNLTTIAMGSGYDVENNAVKYLKTKVGSEQDKLIQRLSNIEHISLRYRKDDYCLNSVKFMLKYMTGLESISFSSARNNNWSEEHRTLFYSLISKIPNLKDYDQLNQMNLSILSKCFPILLKKVFSTTTASTKSRELHVQLDESNNICVTPDESYIEINLTLDEGAITLPGIVERFFKTAYDNVDVFSLKFRGRSSADIPPQSDICFYDMILSQMPSLKELSIDVTAEFDDQGYADNCQTELPLVEKFSIRATVEAKFQSLLDKYHFTLPNLKHFSLYYHTGNWEKSVGEFRLQLPKYSLDSLLLDVTPVKTKSVDYLEKGAFFVLEVEILSTDERHVYKLSLDLSAMTKLNYGDLKGSMRGEDYYLVRITIRNLQNLKLFVYTEEYEEGDEDYTEYYAAPSMVVLKNNVWET